MKKPRQASTRIQCFTERVDVILNRYKRLKPSRHASSETVGAAREVCADIDVSMVPLDASDVPPVIWCRRLRTLADFEELHRRESDDLHSRAAIEDALAEMAPAVEPAFLPGYCVVCKQHRAFFYDRKYAAAGKINWRERMVCQGCGLNNRLRLNAMALRSILRNFGTEPRIYATEQLTPFAEYLRRAHPGTEFSEFISVNAQRGSVNERGVRHEDVTSLSYPDATFDVIICLEVLEHVPNYPTALAEFSRVLRPGGYLLLSVPTALGSAENIVRARVTPDGSVDHICTPEYHGDPLNPENGILCFYHFGWQLLDEIKAAGFRNAFNDMYWSLLLGNIGQGQVLTTAIR